MEKSHCYNPFVYIKTDNDVQKLVTNLFKSTTPKGSSTNDPFWDTAASMLLLALIFYLKYEAPEEEQNFVMVMELLRADQYIRTILSGQVELIGTILLNISAILTMITGYIYLKIGFKNM